MLTTKEYFAVLKTRFFNASRLSALIIPLFASAMANAQSTSQVNLALLGDSIVDDYLGPSGNGNTNLAAGSFGQVMAATRGNVFNFGDYRAPTSNPADQWDSIRKFGYEYNWATAGATASVQDYNFDYTGRNVSGTPGVAPDEDYVEVPIGSNLSSQVAGLTPLIQAGEIDTAIIAAGPNDFFFHTTVFDQAQGGSYDAPDAAIDDAFINYVADSILDAIDAIQAAGDVDIILGELAEVPVYDQVKLDGIAAVNEILKVEAAARGVVVIDLLEWTTAGDHVDPETGNINVGHVEVEYGSAAFWLADTSTEGDGEFCTFEGRCPLDSHATKFLSEDGMHLNTMMQGLLANEFITALNDNFGHDIELISDRELLNLAGVAAVPVPAAVWLFGSALLGLAGIKRKK